MLAVDGAARAILPAQLARFAYAAEALLGYVFVAERSGYGLASLLLALYTVTLAAVWPVYGRLIDSFGVRAIALSAGLTHMAAAVTLYGGSSGWATACGMVGLAVSMPPLGTSIRAIWASLLGSDEARAFAFALESVLIEVFFVAGPLVAAGLRNLVGLDAALLLDTSMVSIGLLGLGLAPVANTRSRTRGLAPAGSGVARYLPLLSAMALGAAAFGVLQALLPAERDSGLALLAVPACASVLGGLIFANARPTAHPWRRYQLLLLSCVLGSLPFAISTGWWWQGLALIAFGLPLAATNSQEFSLLDCLVPSSSRHHVFAWAATSMALGGGVGQLAGGLLVANDVKAAARVLPTAALGCALVLILVVSSSSREAHTRRSG